MTKLEEYKEGLKRRKVKLTDEEKQIVEELDDNMYTVEFLEDYSEYNDTKGPNALLLFMSAHGFRSAMSAIIRNRTERRGEVSNIRKRLFPVFEEIDRERKRQEEKWGEQNHRMLFNPHEFIPTWLETFREDNENKSSTTWFSILMEEVCEAFAETDMEKQREEMVQVAAVAVQIIEYLDRRMEARHENEK